MKGLLIYDHEGKNRNEWFIGELINTAKKYDHELELLVVDRNESFSLESFPDFALVRVIAPHINEYLEKNGVKVFNNFKTYFLRFKSFYGNILILVFNIYNHSYIRSFYTKYFRFCSNSFSCSCRGINLRKG